MIVVTLTKLPYSYRLQSAIIQSRVSSPYDPFCITRNRSLYVMSTITPMRKRMLSIDPVFTASYNREEEWRRCCATVMGFEWVDRFDEEKTNADADEYHCRPSAVAASPDARIQQVINLMEEEDEEQVQQSSHDGVDHWTENALRIQSDLTRMAHWIQSKQHEYVGLDMPDEEASLIQSTVTTFAATTASELETLRKLISRGRNTSTVAGHRNGIVQILLNQLQEEITRPFGILQKQRTRISVKLWQHPWQCQLALTSSKAPSSSLSSTSRVIKLFDDDHDDDQEGSARATKEKRFIPRNPLPTRVGGVDFLDKYENDPLLDSPTPRRPDFLERLANTTKQHTAGSTANDEIASAHPMSRPLPVVPMPRIQATPNPTPSLPFEEQQQQQQDELQQEAALLQVSIVQSDLDSVQKMEQRMVEITTLIGQFSNLVSEQQEEIYDIAHHAQETKKNMSKGQENLVDATERTKRSKHYLAWTIFGLSLTLLFFHTLRN